MIIHSSEAIRACAPHTSDDIRRLPCLVTFSPGTAKLARELLKFLYNRFYHHPVLTEINRRSVDCLTSSSKC